jgi:hypothetical protein
LGEFLRSPFGFVNRTESVWFYRDVWVWSFSMAERSWVSRGRFVAELARVSFPPFDIVVDRGSTVEISDLRQFLVADTDAVNQDRLPIRYRLWILLPEKLG